MKFVITDFGSLLYEIFTLILILLYSLNSFAQLPIIYHTFYTLKIVISKEAISSLFGVLHSSEFLASLEKRSSHANIPFIEISCVKTGSSEPLPTLSLSNAIAL